jgi:hypothetical protein
VSQYLRQELHGLLESVDKSHIPEMYEYVKEYGGYFKRFTGGLLSPWINPFRDGGEMDLHARATLSFVEVRTLLRTIVLVERSQTITIAGRQKPRSRSSRQSVRIYRLYCYPSFLG